jgi:hypothetical protein
MSLPRFSREYSSTLSSVVHPPCLQLNHLPPCSLSSRLLVEPLALRLATRLEAPEDHNCRFLSYVFSMDPIEGFDCVL